MGACYRIGYIIVRFFESPANLTADTPMLRTTSIIAWMLLLATPIASARVIDDFTVGGIALEDHYINGYATASQTDLDPAHVAGGRRTWRYDVGKMHNVTPPETAVVRMGVTTEPSPRYFYDADDGLTAINFSLLYDAGVGNGVGPGLALDFAAEGHNAIAIDFEFANFDDDNGYFNVGFRDIANTFNRWTPIPNSATPFRIVAPLRDNLKSATSPLKLVWIGTGNGYMFGSYAISRIITASTADFNADGVVDGADFLVWQRHAGSNAPANSNATGDADLDGVVDADDLTFWRLAAESAGAGLQSLPEPASGLLATAAIIAAIIAASAVRSRRPRLVSKAR
ncbi:dockerin type I domain-containing protein [Lacipirellula limnantheis]|uniref:PEP-CTERM protein-sorting domain-containing protein n=1 Tax=Lacipirellula limnantheis TaxID=2528024 RepID=A0A517TVK2_9BACT|nr:dockerin type I domain-containing protein [Lacipirellula limnantheis]QDT72406.1 hypothetical protein I41_15840 [Lacipirellula limnantheis]